MSGTWPSDTSVFHADRVDVGIGTGILAVGCGLLYLLVGWAPVVVIAGTMVLLTLAFGAVAVARGQRGLGVVLHAVRLAVGFLGRWFSGW